MFDLEKLKQAQNEANEKLTKNSTKAHTMTVHHDQKPNTVVVSLIPGQLGDLEIIPCDVPFEITTVSEDNEYFYLKRRGQGDDPIKSFLWKRYEKNGKDKSFAIPRTSYLVPVYVHENEKDKDKEGTVQVLRLSQGVMKEIINHELDDDETVKIGVINVAKIKISYILPVGAALGQYTIEFLDPVDLVKTEKDLKKLIVETREVSDGLIEACKRQKENEENYDETIDRFIDVVGILEWNEYAPSKYHKDLGSALSSSGENEKKSSKKPAKKKVSEPEPEPEKAEKVDVEVDIDDIDIDIPF